MFLLCLLSVTQATGHVLSMSVCIACVNATSWRFFQFHHGINAGSGFVAPARQTAHLNG
jgi:hypothetical protein